MSTGLVMAFTNLAFAQDTMDARSARGQLFDHRGGEVVLLPNDVLTEEQQAQLSQMGGAIPYYGAIAVAPDEGFLSEANQAAANHHSIASAEVAALAACNQARTSARACVIVMHFLPRNYEAGRALEMSQTATEAFREYRRGRDEKAFAISAATGNHAFAKGVGAVGLALEACNVGDGTENTAATDCYTVIQD
ncbi:5-aminolevulic acid synthase [Halocynthiibacter styelae]|uniref:5-aminolevulic acid synthase n=1 Tax=Halocynthiibacter styelae TaxID=2761955 RepID=A0A8J7IDF8_9RHOB|nr:5-aminolevulic acid synthase [Paenihalocynthiibacter styelae]MBI1494398.1 5-aminolevulic acid synthase [Paenihalocynthiibacter styelae]